MNAKYKCDLTLMGKRIASARKLSGMTQEQLANKLGIGVKHLSEIERGLSGIAVGTLTTLVKTLNVSSDYILFGEDANYNPLNSKLEKLQPYQRMYLEEMIDVFIGCCLDEKCYNVKECTSDDKDNADSKPQN